MSLLEMVELSVLAPSMQELAKDASLSSCISDSSSLSRSLPGRLDTAKRGIAQWISERRREMEFELDHRHVFSKGGRIFTDLCTLFNDISRLSSYLS